MKILGKRILIEPVKAIVSSGGIHLPEKDGTEGIVLAIGSGIKESRPYTKGSKVFISMYSGMKVQVMGKDRIMVEQDDICGVDIHGFFHPIADNILLKPVDEIVQGGIIIQLPDFSKDASEYKDDPTGRFTVYLCGNGIKKRNGDFLPFELAVGDTVFAKPFSGRDVDTPRGTFKLIKHSDILAKVE